MNYGRDTSWEATYRSFTQDCGIVALSEWSQVSITGSDRATFLNNLCTNDIRRLAAGRCCEAFLLNVKGKIQAHVFVFIEEERISLLSVPGHAARIMAHLERYIIREDVQLADVSEELTWAMIVGPASQEKRGSYLELQTAPLVENGHLTTGNVAGDSCLLARLPLLWPGCFLVRLSAGHPLSNLLEAPLVDTESPVWNALRLESQFPLWGVDFDETNLPQEVNRDLQTISFTKGCYLGQETVARLDALGHVNKKLVLLALAGETVPETGTQLTRDDIELGRVSSVSWSPHMERILAIALIRRGANELGDGVESPLGRAEVIPPVQTTK